VLHATKAAVSAQSHQRAAAEHSASHFIPESRPRHDSTTPAKRLCRRHRTPIHLRQGGQRVQWSLPAHVTRVRLISANIDHGLGIGESI
jgi:hypothetical protein